MKQMKTVHTVMGKPMMWALVFSGITAACSTPPTSDVTRASFVQPTSVTDAAQWLQSEGYDILKIDRSISGQLRISSRNPTNLRLTVLDAETYAVIEDVVTPRPDAALANDDEVTSRTVGRGTNRDDDDNDGNTAATTSSSEGPSASATGNASASSGDSGRPTNADVSTNVTKTSESETTTSNSGRTETRGSITNSASGTASSSIGE